MTMHIKDLKLMPRDPQTGDYILPCKLEKCEDHTEFYPSCIACWKARALAAEAKGE